MPADPDPTPPGAGAVPTGLRAQNALRARQRILDAVVELIGDRGDADVSMPQVAAASGVSLRTLYRYYPTRQDLIDAVATVADQAVASDLPGAALSLDDAGPWLTEAWGNLLAHEVFIRAQHTSPNGAAIRRARIPFFREVVHAVLLREEPTLGNLDPADLEGLVDTVLLLTSSAAMFELIDVLELPVDRAATLAGDAVRAVVAQHVERGGVARGRQRRAAPGTRADQGSGTGTTP